jgi:hypothetical protein
MMVMIPCNLRIIRPIINGNSGFSTGVSNFIFIPEDPKIVRS